MISRWLDFDVKMGTTWVQNLPKPWPELDECWFLVHLLPRPPTCLLMQMTWLTDARNHPSRMQFVPILFLYNSFLVRGQTDTHQASCLITGLPSNRKCLFSVQHKGYECTIGYPGMNMSFRNWWALKVACNEFTWDFPFKWMDDATPWCWLNTT